MSNANIEIGRLAMENLDEAGAVLDAAFQRKGMAGGLGLAFALQPESWICARREGRIIAVVGAYDYGPVASIGMMAVHPSAQRLGIGERLLASLIEYLESRGCPILFLDASAAGQHLYPKLGFEAEGETLRMKRPWPPPQTLPPAPLQGEDVVVSQPERRDDIEQLIAFDAPNFGANRTAVIRSYCSASPPGVFIAHDGQGQIAGYLLARANHIGPWVASSPAAARSLLDVALRLPFDGPVWLTCPAANTDAVALLSAHGFVVTERLLHMQRGGSRDPRRTEHVYSQASLTLG